MRLSEPKPKPLAIMAIPRRIKTIRGGSGRFLRSFCCIATNTNPIISADNPSKRLSITYVDEVESIERDTTCTADFRILPLRELPGTGVTV
jgi:hypothetical protein